LEKRFILFIPFRIFFNGLDTRSMHWVEYWFCKI